MAESHHPRVGVGVLLVDESGRVLLTLRDRPPEAGHWSIVGGKLDFLETLEQCAVRETLEEIGVNIAIASLLCVTDHCLPAEGQHWVSPAYLARILSGEAKNCEPHKTREVRWFPPDNLPPNLTMTAKNAITAYKALWDAAAEKCRGDALARPSHSLSGNLFSRAASACLSSELQFTVRN